MKAVFTCGGTGGHINPALAVARVLLERRPDSEILFVGAEDGMEATLVPREGFRLETLQISSYMRSLKPSAIRHNVRAALSIRRALKKADRIIRDFQPDVILGTGGYASYPMLHEGARLGIPTAVHESNAVPGLATKMVADKVDRILVSFADSRSAYHDPSRVIAVGMPVREEFVFTRRAARRLLLGQSRRAGNEQEDRAVHEARMRAGLLAAYPCDRLVRLALDAGLCEGAGSRAGKAPAHHDAGIYL